MFITFVALNCLFDLRAHEIRLSDYLPGNQSAVYFSACSGTREDRGGTIDGIGRWTMSQAGVAGVDWIYKGKIYTHIDVNEKCEIVDVQIVAKPNHQMLRPMLEEARQAIYQDFKTLIQERPEYRVVCDGGVAT